MIPGKELMDLLKNRLRERLAPKEIERLAAEISALESGWDEVDVAFGDMGYSVSVGCADICWLADQVDRGGVFKIYRKKGSGRPQAGGAANGSEVLAVADVTTRANKADVPRQVRVAGSRRQAKRSRRS